MAILSFQSNKRESAGNNRVAKTIANKKRYLFASIYIYIYIFHKYYLNEIMEFECSTRLEAQVLLLVSVSFCRRRTKNTMFVLYRTPRALTKSTRWQSKTISTSCYQLHGQDRHDWSLDLVASRPITISPCTRAHTIRIRIYYSAKQYAMYSTFDASS